MSDLEITSVYGIREYKRGAIVNEHIDICNSHIFGGILNIAQNVSEEWYLRIYDNSKNMNEITMKPQDLILYESARCIHARPYPLNGDYYANAFVHFKPKNWKCPLY